MDMASRLGLIVDNNTQGSQHQRCRADHQRIRPDILHSGRRHGHVPRPGTLNDMGRAPTRDKTLPTGSRARHRKSRNYYYLNTGAKPREEIPLGTDYVMAVQKWAELTVVKLPKDGQITFRYVAERYVCEVIPSKAPRTQQDNMKELANLYAFFDAEPTPMENIDPIHVRQYLDWRARQARADARRKPASRSHRSTRSSAKSAPTGKRLCSAISGTSPARPA
jgi:hypothetical protein